MMSKFVNAQAIHNAFGRQYSLNNGALYNQ